MLRTTVAPTDPVDVLIALKSEENIIDDASLPANTSHLAAVFRKINAGSEHSTDVSVTLIKSFLDDCLEMIDNRLVLVDTPQMLPG